MVDMTNPTTTNEMIARNAARVTPATAHAYGAAIAATSPDVWPFIDPTAGPSSDDMIAAAGCAHAAWTAANTHPVTGVPFMDAPRRTYIDADTFVTGTAAGIACTYTVHMNYTMGHYVVTRDYDGPRPGSRVIHVHDGVTPDDYAAVMAWTVAVAVDDVRREMAY